jgi:hypothetical protein
MPKCLPQHPILEHPQLMSLPQGETKPHTYTQQQAKLHFCISRYLNLLYHSHPKSSINVRFCLCVFYMHSLVRQVLGYYTKIDRGSLLKILTHLTLQKLCCPFKVLLSACVSTVSGQ